MSNSQTCKDFLQNKEPGLGINPRTAGFSLCDNNHAIAYPSAPSHARTHTQTEPPPVSGRSCPRVTNFSFFFFLFDSFSFLKEFSSILRRGECPHRFGGGGRFFFSFDYLQGTTPGRFWWKGGFCFTFRIWWWGRRQIIRNPNSISPFLHRRLITVVVWKELLFNV